MLWDETRKIKQELDSAGQGRKFMVPSPNPPRKHQESAMRCYSEDTEMDKANEVLEWQVIETKQISIEDVMWSPSYGENWTRLRGIKNDQEEESPVYRQYMVR